MGRKCPNGCSTGQTTHGVVCPFLGTLFQSEQLQTIVHLDKDQKTIKFWLEIGHVWSSKEMVKGRYDSPCETFEGLFLLHMLKVRLMDRTYKEKVESGFQQFLFIQWWNLNLSSIFKWRLDEHLHTKGVRNARVEREREREREKMEKQWSHLWASDHPVDL